MKAFSNYEQKEKKARKSVPKKSSLHPHRNRLQTTTNVKVLILSLD